MSVEHIPHVTPVVIIYIVLYCTGTMYFVYLLKYLFCSVLDHLKINVSVLWHLPSFSIDSLLFFLCRLLASSTSNINDPDLPYYVSITTKDV